MKRTSSSLLEDLFVLLAETMEPADLLEPNLLTLCLSLIDWAEVLFLHSVSDY